jgi:hypothetical protein
MFGKARQQLALSIYKLLLQRLACGLHDLCLPGEKCIRVKSMVWCCAHVVLSPMAGFRGVVIIAFHEYQAGSRWSPAVVPGAIIYLLDLRSDKAAT